MANGEDWLMRPVGHHMCQYESLLDGTLSLVDIAAMNDWLDVKDENEHRINEAMRDHG